MLTATKLIAAVALLTMLVPAVARAQVFGAGEGAVVESTRTYGVKDAIAYTLGAFKFTGFDAANSAKFSANSNGSRGCSSGAACIYEAAVTLPAGAQVTAMHLGACDQDSFGEVVATFYRIADSENPPIAALATVATGQSSTNGCGLYVTSGFSETIDNAHNVYGIAVTLTQTFSNRLDTRFWAVRLYYNLHVSPAARDRDLQRRPDEPHLLSVHRSAGCGRDHGWVQHHATAVLSRRSPHPRPDGGVPQPGPRPALRPLIEPRSGTSARDGNALRELEDVAGVVSALHRAEERHEIVRRASPVGAGAVEVRR